MSRNYKKFYDLSLSKRRSLKKLIEADNDVGEQDEQTPLEFMDVDDSSSVVNEQRCSNLEKCNFNSSSDQVWLRIYIRSFADS